MVEQIQIQIAVYSLILVYYRLQNMKTLLPNTCLGILWHQLLLKSLDFRTNIKILFWILESQRGEYKIDWISHKCFALSKGWNNYTLCKVWILCHIWWFGFVGHNRIFKYLPINGRSTFAWNAYLCFQIFLKHQKPVLLCRSKMRSYFFHSHSIRQWNSLFIRLKHVSSLSRFTQILSFVCLTLHRTLNCVQTVFKDTL